MNNREFTCKGLAAILEVTLHVNSVQYLLAKRHVGLTGFIAFQSKGFGVIHPIELNRESWGPNRVANSFVLPPRWTLIQNT